MNFVQPIREPEKVDIFEEILKSREPKLRDYLIWLFGAYAGLRCGDILSLDVKDVRDKIHIDIIEQKTGNPKTIKIHPKIRPVLKEYLKGRKDYEPLFKSREGSNRPLTTTRVYQIFNEVARKAGIKGAFGTHSGRKTFGYWFYQQNKKLAFLKNWFGHSSEDVTAAYIGLSQDIFDKAVDKLQIGTKSGKRKKVKKYEEVD
jgi:integrase